MNDPQRIPFDYHQAFSRNVGWVTDGELDVLKNKKIAIAGLGGVGGAHLLTHVRMGIGQFNIADFDTFELVNFNRQVGASMSHLGQPKVDVMTSMALDINPELSIQKFEEGIDEDNFEAFFNECDLFIDGLDFFATDIRQKAFAYCYSHDIPALTAAPLGLGVALLVFMPGKMSFESYFKMGTLAPEEKLLRFITGLAPLALHRYALVDRSKVQFKEQKGPSLSIGCEFCAAMSASTTLKLFLQRGKIICAPHGLQFDAYTQRIGTSWRPFGAYHPLQYIQRMIVRHMLKPKV